MLARPLKNPFVHRLESQKDMHMQFSALQSSEANLEDAKDLEWVVGMVSLSG